MYNNIYLPNDIIIYILKLTNIKCHSCHKTLDYNFYTILNKKYYCSITCYNFI